MIPGVIFSTGAKHSKVDSWALESANHTKNTPFPNLKSCLSVYTTLLRPISSFHGAGVYQTLFIDFAR